MAKTKFITAEQRAYIKAHLNDRPRTATAKAAGVCMSTLYRVIREMHGELDHSRCYRHPAWWDEYIRRHYPNESAVQIACAIGSIKGRVNKIAHELGVKHSDEFLAKERERVTVTLAVARQNVDQAARTAKWLRTRRVDEVRLMYGLKRKTKFRFKQITKRSYQAKWHLLTKYNYFADEGNAYQLYYDSETRRMNESYYTDKYGLEFAEAEENSQS